VCVLEKCFLCGRNRMFKYFFLRGEGPRSRCYGRTATLRLLVQPLWWRWAVFFYQVLQLMEHQWNEIVRGKPTTRIKTCPSATLSTTNLTWTDPGSNPGLRGENVLSIYTNYRLQIILSLFALYQLLTPSVFVVSCNLGIDSELKWTQGTQKNFLKVPRLWSNWTQDSCGLTVCRYQARWREVEFSTSCTEDIYTSRHSADQ
jgi:hypothetical protein